MDSQLSVTNKQVWLLASPKDTGMSDHTKVSGLSLPYPITNQFFLVSKRLYLKPTQKVCSLLQLCQIKGNESCEESNVTRMFCLTLNKTDIKQIEKEFNMKC